MFAPCSSGLVSSSCAQTPSFSSFSYKNVSEDCGPASMHQVSPARSRDTDAPVEGVDQLRNEAILSVVWRSGRIGAAVYDAACNELQAVADIMENPADCSILRSLFYQVKPKVLIVKSKETDHRMAIIRQLVGLASGETISPGDQQAHLPGDDEVETGSLFNHDSLDDEESGFLFRHLYHDEGNSKRNCHLYCVPSGFYNLESAKRKLAAIRLPTQPEDISEVERLMHLRSYFPLDCPAVTQATGALLKVMEQWKRGQDLEHLMDVDPEASLTVLSIRILRLDDLVWIDQSVFLSLKIFSSESHPSSFKKGQASSEKEGLSLFGIASKCHSTPGYCHLRNMFLRPTRNIQVLEQRYSVIRFCMQHCNLEKVQNMIDCLRHVSDVKTSLYSISIMQGTVNDWKKLLTTATHLTALSDLCKTLPQEIDLFANLAGIQTSGDLHQIASIVHRLINFQESKRCGRCVINSGVDDDLDQMKNKKKNMSRIYREVLENELKTLPACARQASIEFLPQIGHCLVLHSWFSPGEPVTPDTIGIPHLEFKFSTAESIYCKSQNCHELDKEFGDYDAEIAKYEMALMLSASNAVLKKCADLISCIELAAQLDALLSLSALSAEFDMVEPELITNEHSRISIENGRHILMQLIVDSFHPNMTTIGGSGGDAPDKCPRINIITGPNSSGKSVFLKQTAVIVFLAQIGCFVPATRLVLTPVEHIFVISHAPETVAAPLSQFAVELNQMSIALREANGRSLVIIDEFAQGTSPVDGSALYIACLEHWLGQGLRSPLVLTATHLHSAALFLSRSDFPVNPRYMSMAFTCEDDELVFLYKPIDHLCGNSFPFSVANAVGIQKDVISRGQQVFRMIDEGGSLTPHHVLKNPRLAEELRRTADVFFSTDANNADDLKQFLRRSVMEPLEVLFTPGRTPRKRTDEAFELSF